MDKDNEAIFCDICSSLDSETSLVQLKKDSYLCVDCIAELWKTAITFEPDILQNFHSFLNEEHVFFSEKNNHQQTITPTEELKNIKSPKQIHAFLDEYVIGQHQAKKVIAVAVYNHYKRILSNAKEIDEGVEIEKSNILLVGSTGTGKTLIAKTIARILEVPFAIADATVFTEAGYVGEDVESILTRLLQDCNYDINKAERGIVYIDEIDKLARKQDNPSITRDVSGEGVQQGLLKLLEGSKILVPPQGGRKHPDQKMLKVDTKNILFICGGAFDGMEKLISKRINVQFIGFKSKEKTSFNKTEVLSKVLSIDLKNYGLIPELIGRLPVLTFLLPLDKVALKEILMKPKNALFKQYKQLFKIDNIDVEIKNDAMDVIVQKAFDTGLGARGLRTICENIFNDWMYELPDLKKKKLVITKKEVEQKLRNYDIVRKLSA